MQDRKIPSLQDLASRALIKQGLFKIEIDQDSTPSYQRRATSVIEQVICEKLIPEFLQAVIDDDRKKVAELLGNNPKLFLIDMPDNFVIESQLTWQKFYSECPLAMACKRKQFEMVKLLLPYYEQLEQTEEVIEKRNKALASWACYILQQNADGENEIIIPEDYAKLADELIDVFSKEDFTDGKLSKETELALQMLFNTLLPNEAVKLDDYLDVELFLLTMYKAYDAKFNFNVFQNGDLGWQQRDAFCVRVIGLIQSALSPETATLYCASLKDVVTAIENGKEISISDIAMQHKLKDGRAFYRESRDSLVGLGYQFLCGTSGFSCHGGLRWLGRLLEKSCQAKATNFRNVTQQLPRHPNQLSEDRMSGCVIF